MPIPLTIDYVIARLQADRGLRDRDVRHELSGVRLSGAEAHAAWPAVLEHKWLLSERLGRDVGLRVAAADSFDNVRAHRGAVPRRLLARFFERFAAACRSYDFFTPPAVASHSRGRPWRIEALTMWAAAAAWWPRSPSSTGGLRVRTDSKKRAMCT